MEALSEQEQIDLLYGDESRVSLLPCVPYGWQFADEQVAMPSERGGGVSERGGGVSERGGGVNCFALLSRQSECQEQQCLAHLTEGKITAAWISERLDVLSLSLRRLTVVVLDNATVHTKAVKDRGHVWQERGLFVWFLPTYSPHLNIAEVLWRKLKYEWLRPEDYADEDTLRLAVWTALKAVGKSLKIAFSPFKKNLENSLT